MLMQTKFRWRVVLQFSVFVILVYGSVKYVNLWQQKNVGFIQNKQFKLPFMTSQLSDVTLHKAGSDLYKEYQNKEIARKAKELDEKTLFANMSIDLKKINFTDAKWINLFPSVRNIMEQAKDGNFPLGNMTSAEHTKVVSSPKIKYFVGNVWKGRIIAYTRDKFPQIHGGDYFKAALYRTIISTYDGVSCTVHDNHNGTYEVECPIPWPGHAYLRVFLEFPKETIYLHSLFTSKPYEYFLIKNHSFINSLGKREYGICDIGLHDRYNDSELCNHTNPTNGEPWFCVKLPSGECPDIEKQLEKVICDLEERKVRRHKYNKLPKEIGAGYALDFPVEKSTDNNNNMLDSCCKKNYKGPDINPAKATGWRGNKIWNSFECRHRAFDAAYFSECMKNKTIYIVGDSVAFQWFRFLLNVVRLGVMELSSSGWSKPLSLHSRTKNVTLHYRGHGPPFHAIGPPSFRPYITDTLDSIKSTGSETLFLFTIGVHFGGYDPDIFINRLQRIKKSILRLLSRHPRVSIYVIGMNPHGLLATQRNGWVMLRQEVISREVFGNIKGVIYLQFWDMSSVSQNKKVHVLSDHLLLEMSIFQSYLCS